VSLAREFAEYYAARAPRHDEEAGFLDEEAERLREPIKDRYRRLFAGRRVLELACGTGYWTEVVAGTARSVHATDIHSCMLDQAKTRCAHHRNVTFGIEDAYALDELPDNFTAAFAVWWWSHVPLGRLREFLDGLHRQLQPGTMVHFVDHLPYDRYQTRHDSEGNRLELRTLLDGRIFEVVKNFPTEDEIRAALSNLARDVGYCPRPDENSWSVSYIL
jgi:ubiquinone/menaquinone biosynthesis C-methylase UbiE